MRDLRLIVLGNPPHARPGVELDAQAGKDAGTFFEQSCAVILASVLIFTVFFIAAPSAGDPGAVSDTDT